MAGAVYDWLKNRGLEDRIVVLDEPVDSVESIAKQIGCSAKAIAKTHDFFVNVRNVIVVMSNDAQADISRIGNYIKDIKAGRFVYEEVIDNSELLSDVICLFGHDKKIDVELDLSLRRFDYVYLQGGDKYTLVKLKPSELHDVLDSKGWRNVCTGWRDRDFLFIGQYAFMEDGRLIIIDEVLEPGKRYIGRDVNKKDLPVVEIRHKDIKRVADEICRSVDIE